MITKTYKINNDCIKQLQHCCDEHYQTCEDFTKEEIHEIKNLQTEMNRIIFQLGQLKISEVRLKKAGDNLKNALESAEQKETDLAQKFSDKYGKGSLDIETGKFTPTE